MSELTTQDLARALMTWAPGVPENDAAPVARVLAGITRRDVETSHVSAAMRAAQEVAWAEDELGWGDADDRFKARRRTDAARRRLEEACTRVLEARLL